MGRNRRRVIYCGRKIGGDVSALSARQGDTANAKPACQDFLSQQSQNQTAREMMFGLLFSSVADSKSCTGSEPEESTLDTGRIVAELKRERDRLNLAIAALDGQSPKSAARTSAVPHRAARSKKKRDNLTPAGRKRLSDMMKNRWAERRKKGSKRQ
jgi:hypothetical protein